MRCEGSRKLLVSREDGALSPREERRVAEHLEGCERCRALRHELAQARRWIESAPPPPLAEEDFAAIRRGVWREIEARGLDSRRRAFARRSAGFAAAGLAAAALASIWLARRTSEPAPVRLAPPAAAPIVAALEEPSPAGGVARPVSGAAPSAPSGVSPAPARVVRAARRRAAPAGEPAFSRVEFRTANPNVRVIWLVEKGRRNSSVPTAGRKQEVS